VSVTGFTVQDSGQLNNAAGIYIHANRSSIMGNTITCTQTTGMEGIWCWNTSETLIQRNTIENYYYGIALENSISSALQDNNVTGTRAWAILLGNTNESGVTGNVMTGNTGGLYLRDSHRNMIYGNTIKQNTHAIYLAEIDGTTGGNNITSNNFIRNTGPGPWFFLGNQSHSKNLWDKNYYGRTLLHPKIIYGQKKILSLPGAPFHLPPMDIVIPWFAFDRHPAQTPYI
ncbi:MAG TPA: right-handed parallel beta-helix repeat-containing protein, partial [Candidatus Thermoplasmatota archaeon]|nr:right-handed parallel beta-helix repeat-containing protein [Candidatus Thermoplasmatota archaeon]